MDFDELMLLIDCGILVDLVTAVAPLLLLNKVSKTISKDLGLWHKEDRARRVEESGKLRKL